MIHFKGKLYILSALLIIILFSCVMEPPAEKPSFDLTEHKLDLDKILKRGKLIVLAENSSSTYFNYREKDMGFEYEILKEFSKEIGVEMEVKVIDNLDNVFEQMKRGEGDILACNLTVNKEREKTIAFSTPLMSIPQVLVQRKKINDTIEGAPFISDPSQLARKKVNVWAQSSYHDRLVTLQEEIGDTIYIQEENGIKGSDELIEEVSEGIIDYTIVEANVAQINARFFDNLDVSVPISAKQKIAFGLRQSSPLLKARLDAWLTEFTASSVYKYIYHKYFELGQIGYLESTPETLGTPQNIGKGKLTDYKVMFEAAGKKHNINWRWLAALSYQESRFDPNAISFGGAYSMMQFMPEIGPTFGVYPDSPPEVQIMGGAKKLQRDIQSWKSISGELNKIKFALASYNCGQGHVYDAQRLATKYGKDPNVWDDNVEEMILQLSKKEFYGDPVVRHGSMRGTITYKYVREIYARFLQYSEEYK